MSEKMHVFVAFDDNVKTIRWENHDDIMKRREGIYK